MNPLLLDDYDSKLIGRATGEFGKDVELVSMAVGTVLPVSCSMGMEGGYATIPIPEHVLGCWLWRGEEGRNASQTGAAQPAQE